MAELYHVTTTWLDPEVLIKPRVPAAGTALNEDRTIPRISVAASVEECLLGITFGKLPRQARVYRVIGEAKGADYDSPAKHVPDWDHHNEVWLREPNRFKFVGYIDIGVDIGDGIIEWRWHRKGAKVNVIDVAAAWGWSR